METPKYKKRERLSFLGRAIISFFRFLISFFMGTRRRKKKAQKAKAVNFMIAPKHTHKTRQKKNKRTCFWCVLSLFSLRCENSQVVPPNKKKTLIKKKKTKKKQTCIMCACGCC